jgi:predicted nucleotidyltransferase
VKILNDFKNMVGEVTAHAQQPHISSHTKQLLKKTFPKTEKKQLKEATTKTNDHLKDAMHDFFSKDSSALQEGSSKDRGEAPSFRGEAPCNASTSSEGRYTRITARCSAQGGYDKKTRISSRMQCMTR